MNRHGIVLLSLCLALGGCVSASKLKDQEAKTLNEQKRAQALETELSGVKKDLDATKVSLATTADSLQKTQQASQKAETDLRGQLQAGAEQLASLNVQLTSVQKSNKDLQGSLEGKKTELTKKVSDLIKEKDGLSQKLADAQAETAGLRKAKDAEIAGMTLRAANAETALTAKQKELDQAQADKLVLEKAREAEVAKVTKNYEDLTASLKSEISAGEVAITHLKGKLTVNMVDRILFDSGQAEVMPAGKKVLEKVGKILGAVADKDIRIEGHTDNKPIVGELKNKYATNWELSTARATSVARYLQDNAKMDPKRLVAAGYGEFRPISSNDTPELRAKNRRIEIVLVPRE